MISFEASVSKAWLARALGVAFDREYYLDPFHRREIDRRCHEYARAELADLGAFFTESNLGRRAHHADDQVLVGGIQPNLLLGMLLGAELLACDDRDADITPRCLHGREPDELPASASLPGHELVRRFDAQLAALRAEGAAPIPPFFWDASGRAAVHGSLTTAQKFWGEDFLADLLAAPERAHRILAWITEATIVLVRHFARVGDRDVRELHVGECSACLVGPRQFARFVVPTLARYGAAVAPVRLHSCGPSDHLLPEVADLAALHSLDLGGETSLARVRERWGSDFPVSIAPPVEALAARDPRPLLDWVTRALRENEGGRLVVLLHLEPQYDLDVVRALHERVAGS